MEWVKEHKISPLYIPPNYVVIKEMKVEKPQDITQVIYA